MTSRTDSERLADIKERIERIKFAEVTLMEAESDPESSEASQIAFDAILYNLLVIGEAVKSLSDEFKMKFDFLPWTQITGMRDILAHEYFRVDSTVVIATIDKPLEELKKICEKEVG